MTEEPTSRTYETLKMDYNSDRKRLTIPEYGRNIHQMVAHACSLEDRDERNHAAQTIIAIMGQLNPHLRDVSEFNHKLWDHLFIMSDFTLDVDSPFPIPEPDTLTKKPELLEYPSRDFKYKHYGRTIELFVKQAMALEPGEERIAHTCAIANMMKRSYLHWNRDSVSDEVIIGHLTEISKGELVLPEGFVFENTADILAVRKMSGANGGHSNNSKKKKRSKGSSNSRKKKY